MRGGRTFAAMTLFLAFLAAVALFSVMVQSQGVGSLGQSASVGAGIFALTAGLEALLLLVMTPPLTAGAISSERQQKSFDMLMATPLTPGQVLRGKLSAALSYLVLLVVAAIPINVASLLFGGVTIAQVGMWLTLLLAMLFLTAVVGLWWSVTVRTTALATAMTFVSGLVMLALAPLLYFFMLLALFSGSMNGPSCTAIAPFLLHPVAGALALMQPDIQLPMALPLLQSALYVAGGFVLLVLAEWRLAALAGQRGRAPLRALLATLLLLAVVVLLYLSPLKTFCDSML